MALLRRASLGLSDLWWYTPSRYRVVEYMSDALHAIRQTASSVVQYARKAHTFHHVLVVGDVDDGYCLELMESASIALVSRINAREHVTGLQHSIWNVYSTQCTSPHLTVWKLKSHVEIRKHIMPHLLPYGKHHDGPSNVAVLCCAKNEPSAVTWIRELDAWNVPQENIVMHVICKDRTIEHEGVSIACKTYTTLMKVGIVTRRT